MHWSRERIVFVVHPRSVSQLAKSGHHAGNSCGDSPRSTPARPDTKRLGKIQPMFPQASVLLWRWKPIGGYPVDWSPRGVRRRITNRLIAGGGRGPYCHASLLDTSACQAEFFEVTQFLGGRRLPLSEAVSRYPGVIDVFAPQPRVATAVGCIWDPEQAIREARGIIRSRYGWGRVLWTSLRHTWAGRYLMRPDIVDTNGHGPPFCSDFVSACLRAGGMDPVPNCADGMTEPNDLMRSHFLRYLCTLV